MWLQELAERTASGRPLGPLTSLMGTLHAQAVAPIPCHFFHPEQACWQHPLQLLVPAYGRALSVYIPVYLLPALLVHRQEFLKQPLPILQKVVQGVARWAGLGAVNVFWGRVGGVLPVGHCAEGLNRSIAGMCSAGNMRYVFLPISSVSSSCIKGVCLDNTCWGRG